MCFAAGSQEQQQKELRDRLVADYSEAYRQFMVEQGLVGPPPSISASISDSTPTTKILTFVWKVWVWNVVFYKI